MADRCWRCGSDTSPDDAFCAACGAWVRETGDEAVPTRDAEAAAAPPLAATTSGSRWPLLVGLALIAATVGFFVIADDDDPSSNEPPSEPLDRNDAATGTPDDSPATTAPAEMLVADVDGPLEWAVEKPDGAGVPLAIIERDGSTLFFADDGPGGFGGGTITVSELRPDGTWVEHGEIFESGAVVRAVTATDDGVLATGLDPDGDPTVWRSDDGIAWTPEGLPATSLGSNLRLVPTVIAEQDGVILVAATTSSPWATISEEVHRRFVDLDVAVQPSWTSLDDEVVLVQGPFGLVIDEIPLAEIGIAVEDMQASPVRHPAPVWTFTNDAWRNNLVGGDVVGVAVDPDEPGIIVGTATNTGIDVVRYVDGDWLDVASGLEFWNVRPGPDGGLVALTTDGAIRSLSLLDRDFQRRRGIGLPIGATASVSGWASGQSGIAVATSIWFDRDETIDPERLAFERDGYRLETDGRDLQLRSAGELVGGVEAWSNEPDPAYRVDLDDQAVVFLDPATGTELVRFALAEVAELDGTTVPSMPAVGGQDVTVLFTPDTETWFGGAVGAVEIESGSVIRLDVAESVVRLTIVSATDPGRRNRSPLRFTTLVATIPDP